MVINEIIRKLPNGKYRLYSKNGKNLGTYNSRTGAENREKQVQYFKHANEEKLPSVPTLSIQQIARKHDVDSSAIKRELKMGIKVEFEHTRDPEIAREIALDHLAELPDYYTRLIDMEKQ